jgi:hypothetical protein
LVRVDADARERELGQVGVGVPEQCRAGCRQAGDCRAVVPGRRAVAAHDRTAVRRRAGDVEHVFHADRKAGQKW